MQLLLGDVGFPNHIFNIWPQGSPRQRFMAGTTRQRQIAMEPLWCHRLGTISASICLLLEGTVEMFTVWPLWLFRTALKIRFGFALVKSCVDVAAIRVCLEIWYPKSAHHSLHSTGHLEGPIFRRTPVLATGPPVTSV